MKQLYILFFVWISITIIIFPCKIYGQSTGLSDGRSIKDARPIFNVIDQSWDYGKLWRDISEFTDNAKFSRSFWYDRETRMYYPDFSDKVPSEERLLAGGNAAYYSLEVPKPMTMQVNTPYIDDYMHGSRISLLTKVGDGYYCFYSKIGSYDLPDILDQDGHLNDEIIRYYFDNGYNMKADVLISLPPGVYYIVVQGFGMTPSSKPDGGLKVIVDIDVLDSTEGIVFPYIPEDVNNGLSPEYPNNWIMPQYQESTENIENDIKLSANRNYIYTQSYTNEDGTEYTESIDYFDGLGRKSQIVLRNNTPTYKDIIQAVEYDNQGRVYRNWLPVRVADNNEGEYRSLVQLEESFIHTYGDPVAYTKNEYETSPLQRVMKQSNPGDWGRFRSSDITVLANIQDDEHLNAFYYTVSKSGDKIYLSKKGNYYDEELLVTRYKDENRNVWYKFKDKSDRMILSRQISEDEFFDTYYVYDDRDNLCFVLPPIAVDSLKPVNIKNEITGPEIAEEVAVTDSVRTLLGRIVSRNRSGSTAVPQKENLINSLLLERWDETNEVLQKYAYLYRYDERNRCIAKKLPGCDWIYYVYDKAGQIIFSQDGEQRVEKENGMREWLFNKYDQFGRLILSGVYKTEETWEELITNYEDIIVTEIPDKDSLYGYSWNTLPNDSGSLILWVNYYDTYDFKKIPEFNPDSLPMEFDITKTTYAGRNGDDADFCSHKGLQTGSIVAEINENGVLYRYNAIYYDDRKRIIQTYQTNQQDGYDVDYITYNFIDQPVESLHINYVKESDNLVATQEVYQYIYDHAGRLLESRHRLGNSFDVMVTRNEYNEVGLLKSVNTSIEK